MTTQIAVRLPDDLVEFIDGEVSGNRAESRAAVVRRALTRERRRLAAERDAVIYAAAGPDPYGLDDVIDYTSRLPMDDLD